MRTKQTGKKRAPDTNGKAAGNSRSGQFKSQTQPELNEDDIEGLRIWLDKSVQPFSVAAAPLSKKRKRDAQTSQVQDDLWEERLSVRYEVKPRGKWESLRRYKKFTVGSESIATGQCIFVAHEDATAASINLASQWKAKVLEVKALDSEHVYIRVAWLNRPEDLPGGRKDYHGKNELIPTNQLDIIDAMSINGSVEVMHWNEEDDSTPLGDGQYFWRQSYDFTISKTFSKLKKICIDDKPINPDEMIIQCSDEGCRKWLHVKCIAEEAAKKAAKGVSKTKVTPKKKVRLQNTNSKALAIAANETVTSEVFIRGLPHGQERAATETEIVITPINGEKHAEELRCLFCQNIIED